MAEEKSCYRPGTVVHKGLSNASWSKLRVYHNANYVTKQAGYANFERNKVRGVLGAMARENLVSLGGREGPEALRGSSTDLPSALGTVRYSLNHTVLCSSAGGTAQYHNRRALFSIFIRRKGS